MREPGRYVKVKVPARMGVRVPAPQIEASDDGPRQRSDSSSQRGSSGIERALDILRLFCHSESLTLGVTEIAQVLGLSKAVVHRTLSAFCAKGFLELDESTHRYRLGPESMFLGLTYLDRLDIRSSAHEVLQGLVAITGATATLSVKVGWTRVYLDQVTPSQDVKMVVQLGKPFPLHTGASSKAMLAFLDPAEQTEYIDGHELIRLTPLSITDPKVLREELKHIRAKGYAVSMGERDASAGSVAAPVLDYNGALLAVISVCGPVDSFRAKSAEAATALLDATSGLSKRFGYRGELHRTESS